MLFILLILFFSVLAWFELVFGSQDGRFRRVSKQQELALPLVPDPVPAPKEEDVIIGPLRYTVENPSIITYKDLGYLGNTGNQLFEIAATLSIAISNKCRVVFPTSLRNLSIYKIFDLSHLPIKDVTCDEHILEFDNYEDIVVPSDGRVYSLEGYRQCYLYFEPILPYLQDLFPLRSLNPTKQDYIAVHVRRTDTVNVSWVHKLMNLQLSCSLKYYQEGIRRIRLENNLPFDYPVIVATDDPVWLKDHIKDIDERAVVNPNPTKIGDFELMYHASYLLISNSTFSYWAAMLGSHTCIVAPSYWWPQNSIVHQLTKADHQLICPPHWNFNDPITGDVVNQSYNWLEQDWSSTNKLGRLVRAVFATNILRKETL